MLQRKRKWWREVEAEATVQKITFNSEDELLEFYCKCVDDIVYKGDEIVEVVARYKPQQETTFISIDAEIKVDEDLEYAKKNLFAALKVPAKIEEESPPEIIIKKKGRPKK